MTRSAVGIVVMFLLLVMLAPARGAERTCTDFVQVADENLSARGEGNLQKMQITPSTCDQVRSFVNVHGRWKALAMAVEQGATASQIAAARRCLERKES